LQLEYYIRNSKSRMISDDYDCLRVVFSSCWFCVDFSIAEINSPLATARFAERVTSY